MILLRQSCRFWRPRPISNVGSRFCLVPWGTPFITEKILDGKVPDNIHHQQAIQRRLGAHSSIQKLSTKSFANAYENVHWPRQSPTSVLGVLKSTLGQVSKYLHIMIIISPSYKDRRSKEFHLHGEGVWGRMDTHIYGPVPCCPPETITTLLVSYVCA